MMAFKERDKVHWHWVDTKNGRFATWVPAVVVKVTEKRVIIVETEITGRARRHTVDPQNLRERR